MKLALALVLLCSTASAQMKMLPGEVERVDIQFSCDDDGICSLYAKDLNEIVRLAQRGVNCH